MRLTICQSVDHRVTLAVELSYLKLKLIGNKLVLL